MKISSQELSSIESKLELYKKEHTQACTAEDSLNCYCGASCTSTCSTYCDGGGRGGRNICWQNGGRR